MLEGELCLSVSQTAGSNLVLSYDQTEKIPWVTWHFVQRTTQKRHLTGVQTPRLDPSPSLTCSYYLQSLVKARYPESFLCYGSLQNLERC